MGAKVLRKSRPGSSEADDIARYVFGTEGQVPLTDGLIDQLVIEGWPRVLLLELRKAGAVYSTVRNSVIH